MKERFPIFARHPELVYLDSAATTQKPKEVIDALVRFYSEEYATVHRAVYGASVVATERYEKTRLSAAAFVNATSNDEIVFTKGTTDAINMIALSASLKAGDEIVVSELEHHSNLVPWQLLAHRTSAKLIIIPSDDRGVLLWDKTFSPKTKIVAIQHMSNVTGTIHPIAEMTRAAHSVGAIIVVDGAQAAPHLPIDVIGLGVDFYAFSGHKCYGPTGIGILYGKEERLLAMPPVQGGGHMVERVELMQSTFQKPPLRFEAGTPPIASVIALDEALRFTKEAPSQQDLAEYARRELGRIEGIRLIGDAPERGPIVTFVHEHFHALDIATLLAARQIAVRSGHLCAQPALRRFGVESAVRVSFGAYNTEADVTALLEGLAIFANL